MKYFIIGHEFYQREIVADNMQVRDGILLLYRNQTMVFAVAPGWWEICGEVSESLELKEFE